MGQRTIYVRDEHEPLWDRAKALASDESLSAIIAEGLRAFIQRREVQLGHSQGENTYTHVVVEIVDEDGKTRKVGFLGRQLAQGEVATVYETAKRRLLFHGEPEGLVPYYFVYDDLPEAARGNGWPPALLQATAEALGMEWVEELDV